MPVAHIDHTLCVCVGRVLVGRITAPCASDIGSSWSQLQRQTAIRETCPATSKQRRCLRPASADGLLCKTHWHPAYSTHEYQRTCPINLCVYHSGAVRVARTRVPVLASTATTSRPKARRSCTARRCLTLATGWVHINGSARIYNKPAADQVCDPGPCLFNLQTDPLEQQNLASSTDPAAVAALSQLLARLAEWNATRIPNQVRLQ